jgi:hypothetical protein
MLHNIKKYLNQHCYSFELIDFKKKCIFDSFVDVTYIITMEGSDRLKEVYKKIKEFSPTQKIFIVYNKGYKKCNKILYEQNSAYDLTNANLNIFYHSIINNYNNILILEDDFEFDIKKIMSYNHIENIKSFFDKNKNTDIILNIGPIPISIFPFLIYNNFYKSFLYSAAQCIIFNKNARYQIMYFLLKNNFLYKKSKYWDYFISIYFKNYIYYTPICYQTIPKTENSELWTNPFFDFIINILNLRNKTKPGYEILFYKIIILNYILFIIIFCIVLFILINFIYKAISLK